MVTKNGFTLVEMLVVIVLIGILTATGSMVLFTTLRASSKSQAMTVIKQEGNYALGIMERLIRNTRNISGCNGPVQSLNLENLDRSQTTLGFISDGTLWRLARVDSAVTSFLIGTAVTVDTSRPNFFNCTPGNDSPDQVEIVFTLRPAIVSSRPEEQAFLDFKTTVVSRNY